MIKFGKKQRPSVLLGLSLDGGRLEGLVVRRTNGSVVVQKRFFASLSLDPLTNDPELVGREILNHLEQAGIRERRCAICVPLGWALTLQSKIPEMPEADLPSFLEIEAERGFPYGLDALLIATSRVRSPAGEQYATQVAIPRDHLVRLEKALKAARLKPVTFSIGISALQAVEGASSDGVAALAVSDNSVGLQVSSGGGVAALRTLEGVLETEGGAKHLYSDIVARELRITLGQLPGEMRDLIRHVKVFGQGHMTEELVHDLRLRLEPMGITIEYVTAAGDSLGVKLPPDAELSPALCLAARHLSGRNAALEFLPPKVSSWQQFTSRHSSRKLVWAAGTAAAAALVVAGFFLYQQWELTDLRSQWAAMGPKVTELDGLQQQIRRFRPWFDDSMRDLSILRRLTEAFPEDGVVTAKTVEIREPAIVTCSGSARDNQALLKTLDQLRATKEILDVKVDQIKGGKPLQFTFNFHWGDRGGNEH